MSHPIALQYVPRPFERQVSCSAMDSIELAFSCIPKASLDLLRATALSFVPKLVQRVKLCTCTVLLKTKLGEGGAATVYEAEVTTLDVSADFNEQQAVAVKKVVCSDAAQLRSAEKERDLMKMQLHPGIMPLLDSGTEQTAPPQSRQILYMLMPLYTGGSLWDVVHAQSQPLSNNQILSILEQVVVALEALHAAGWIHRDVKPHNVLLERRGTSAAQRASPTAVPHQPLMGRSPQSLASSGQSSPTAAGASPAEYLCVLTDLGSCCEVGDLKVQSPEDAKRVAACADTACSPLYRSPELYEPPTRGDLDSRVDVWALGCLLYFMMMRVNPFEKQCMQGASLVLAVQRAKVDWSEAPAYLHPDLKELVHACLRPKLQERPTCTELRQWIDRMKAWMGK